MDVYIYMLHVVFFVCGLRWLESLTSVRGVRRPLLVLRVCVWTCMCVSRVLVAWWLGSGSAPRLVAEPPWYVRGCLLGITLTMLQFIFLSNID